MPQEPGSEWRQTFDLMIVGSIPIWGIFFNYLNELDKNLFEILAYADDLCVLCEGKNQLMNIIKIKEKWIILNKINANKAKSGIMIISNNTKEVNDNNIDGYPIITKYKYLGILINDKMNIQSHIGNIYKKLD